MTDRDASDAIGRQPRKTYAPKRDKAEKKANGAYTEGARPEIVWYRDARLDTTSHHVIKTVIDSETIVEVLGLPGSGKTFFVLDVACHVAAGRAWRGLKVRGGVVLYLAPEAGRSLLKRVVAWRQYHQIDDVKLAIRPMPVDLLRPEADTAKIIALCKEIEATHGKIVLVIVDTLSRAMPGGEENASEDMGGFISNCDQIRSYTGATVLIVHHLGKDASRGGRGHSNQLGNIDTEITITEHVATITKQRDGVSGTQFAFKLEVVHLGTDNDGDPITSCIALATDLSEITTGARLSDEEHGWLKDLFDLFADPERQGLKRVRPEPDMPLVWGATRDQVRNWLSTRGRIGVTGGVALTATDRSRLQRYLGRLKDKGKIGISGDAIWIISK